jgi:hypothetical protein
MINQIIPGWLWILRIATGGTVLYRIIIWLDFLVDAESYLADSLWGIFNFNFFWQIPLLSVYIITLTGLRYFLNFPFKVTDRYLIAGLLIVQAADVAILLLLKVN